MMHWDKGSRMKNWCKRYGGIKHVGAQLEHDFSVEEELMHEGGRGIRWTCPEVPLKDPGEQVVQLFEPAVEEYLPFQECNPISII